MICSSTAPAVATPSAAKRSSATSPAAKASPSTRAVVPTSRICSTKSDRRIDVAWAETPSSSPNSPKPTTYPVKLVILVDDRSGLLKEFAAIISEDGTNIKSVETRPADDEAVYVDFVIETLDLRHLTRLTQNLRKVPGVRDVHRVQKV